MVRNPSLEGSCSNHLPQSPCTLLSSSVFKAVRFSASFREHLQAKVSFNPRETPFDYHHEQTNKVDSAGSSSSSSPVGERTTSAFSPARVVTNFVAPSRSWSSTFRRFGRALQNSPGRRLLWFEEDACVDTTSSGSFGPPVERAFRTIISL